MFGNILGSLIDKEAIVEETIKGTLQDLSEELGCQFNELFITIKPIDAEFNMKFYVYRHSVGKPPEYIREIPLKEILE